MLRHASLLTVLLLLASLSPASAEPCSYLVDPTVVVRATGAPTVREWSFASDGDLVEVFVESPVPGTGAAATGVEVRLNGEDLARGHNFKRSGALLRLVASRPGTNVLRLVLRGKRGTAVRLSVAHTRPGFDPALGAWSAGPSPLASWSGHGAAIVGRRMYVVGGQSSGAQTHAFDLDDRTWSRVADIPVTTVHAGVVALEGKVHVVGGQDPALHATMRSGHFAYDPSTDTWATLAPLPVPTTHVPAVALDGKIYVLGGQVGPWFAPSQTDAVHVYDPVTDSWSAGVNLPTPREWIQAATIGGRIYAAGGYQGPFNNAPPSQTRLDVFDPETMQWSSRRPLPEGVQGAAFCAVGPYLVLVGGWDVQLQVNHSNRTHVYDTRTDTWLRGPDTATSDYHASAAWADCELLLVGGGESPMRMDLLRPTGG